MDEKRGITLISLVVTIIVLLILAGVAIAVVITPDGIIDKARNSKADMRYATILDKVKLRESDLEIAAIKGEDKEELEDFIERLRGENLLTKDDLVEDGIIHIGLQKDGKYKYTINIVDGMIESTIAELKNSLKDATEPMKNMTFTIRTTEDNQKIHLPISNTLGLQVNWHAKNNPNNFVNFNEIETIDVSDYYYKIEHDYPVHTYAQSGNYEIQIKGTSQANTVIGNTFHNYPYNDNYELIELKYWGENGFSAFNSLGKNLTTRIPSPTKKSFANTVNFDNAFTYAENITEIPENLFVNASEARSFYSTFEKCYNLKTIPENLFITLVNAVSYNLTFKECFTLTKIPENLFCQSHNAKSFIAVFSQNASLTSIPKNLFKNNFEVVNFDHAFESCFSLTSMPETLFENNLKVESFFYTFAGCYNLKGLAPNLWERRPEPDGNSCFTGCEELDNYDIIPEYWKAAPPTVS